MSKKPYGDITRPNKKIEQEFKKTDSVLNQFFFNQKLKFLEKKFYNLVKKTGSNASGFFNLYFLIKIKIKRNTKTITKPKTSLQLYFLTLKNMNTLTSSVSGRAPEIHTLESGIDRVNARIRELLEINETIIIKVAGGSASGKTTKVSEEILKYFQDQIIKISMDDYYKGKTFMKDEEQKGNDLNWDQPEALNLELLEKHINELRSGRKIKKPVYCMKTSEPIGVESVEPSKLILLEGLFTLRDELTETSELKIFVESDTTTRLTRRILR